MSIKSEIDRISGNVDDALAATAEMGANVPATANSDDLGTLIRSIPKVNVVQTTGDSTEDVMSQAAVTNALDFCVNMTDTESPDPEMVMLECDKTYEQVVEAYTAGRSVYARYVNADSVPLTIPLLTIQDAQAFFVAYTGTETLLIVMGADFGNYAMLIEDVSVGYHLEDTNNPHGVTAAQVGAPTVAEMNAHTENTTVHVTAAERTAWNNKSDFSGSYNDLTNKPTIPAAVTVDSALSSSSANPVQNKVVNSALANKAPAYTYGTADLTAGTSALTTGVLYFVYE